GAGVYHFFFFQAEDGIRDFHVTGVQSVLFRSHVDGWLCEVKDAQIRDGLHVLGEAPAGATRVGLVLAMLRARQMWSGRETLPGLREALGLAEDGTAGLADVDAAEDAARALVQAMEDAGWAPGEAGRVAARHVPGERRELVTRVLEFAATEIVPRLARTPDELDHVLHALDGG